MKGYLTVFLALSLSFMTGFVLLLTGNAVRNAGKVRLECAVDTGMNAVLSEFHRELLERYDLLYVDVSYLGSQPSIANLEERLRYYIEENTSGVLNGSHGLWGTLSVENTVVSSFETAAADRGASMRSQAVCYVEDTGVSGEERAVLKQMETVKFLDEAAPMEEWIGIMEQLAGIELPRIQNEKGDWEEVPLSNPADWVYALAGSDILYLAQADTANISPAKVSLEDYISHRQIQNTGSKNRDYKSDKELFLSYLFDKMGYYGKPRENSLLSCQLEYIAQGKDSDLSNMRAVAETVFRWRFADNAARALADGGLRAEVEDAAGQLLAVTLKEELKAPVAESILYACAFLESISDVRSIYEGGSIPLRKSGHSMAVRHVLSGGLYAAGGSSGLTYGQYLAAMILLNSEEEENLRAMDIMEMDIRLHDGSKNFSMDWCVERFEAEISCAGGLGSHYFIKRKYGYF
ncbi:MAG: DUF5702 domain-containing protein [Clostridium sp.]|nr:DUF5702 domain-containing protein [Clostridium sp.]